MPLLEVDKLSKQYGTVQAVRGLSFSVERGRCVALLGPNGAGKTTTLKMLAQLISPTSGSIRFHGLDGSDLRAFIGYLPQHPAFHEWMTGAEFLEYVGRLSHLTKAEARRRQREILETVGIADAANRPIGGYSGGMKQRLGIAQALIHRPSLLMMDEPVSALDPIGRREILELMAEIRRETTILYSTHVLHDAEEISDDILIMANGEIIISGSLRDLRREYQQPVVRIQAEASLEMWHSSWSGESWVEQVRGTGDSVELLVRDIDIARSHVIRLLSENQIPVRSLEFGLTSLEDLFMKAVKA